MGDPILELRGLTKRFNGRRAVDGVSFEVRPGEVVGLLGPNGAGKTTLIHMVLGLTLPSGGGIRVFGMEMPRRRQAILQRTSFSSAYTQMPYTLSPRENLEIFARLYGASHPRRRAGEMLRRFEIEETADRPTRALSSGQFSRLNLAKALLHDPEFLMLDEPTASMDPEIAAKTRTILKDVAREKGLTILYTSHNMREVEEMATRVLFLHRGRIEAEGSPRELIEQFKGKDLEAVFLKLAGRGK